MQLFSICITVPDIKNSFDIVHCPVSKQNPVFFHFPYILERRWLGALAFPTILYSAYWWRWHLQNRLLAVIWEFFPYFNNYSINAYFFNRSTLRFTSSPTAADTTSHHSKPSSGERDMLHARHCTPSPRSRSWSTALDWLQWLVDGLVGNSYLVATVARSNCGSNTKLWR